jgi:hypothetical protein
LVITEKGVKSRFAPFFGGFEEDNAMTTKGYNRKLSAILSADVKGYGRLMDENE